MVDLNILVTKIATILAFPILEIFAYDALSILTLVLRLFRHPLDELPAEP